MSAFDPRSHVKGETHSYVSPINQVNIGLWILFGSATCFLGLRLWCKVSRKNATGMWYDDHLLIISWLILFMNNILISVEYATGYVQDEWDDRMKLMITISSCGTLVGQALTKTAFGITLLRLSNRYQRWILWACISMMNAYLIVKIILQWCKVCERESHSPYQLNICTTARVRNGVKKGGNILNIIMDFLFAVFPWIITWKLKIEQIEKISLCVTMSLGMIIAIATAVRTAWKDDNAPHDEWYHWGTGMSQIWFSSEVAGTIIVQCVPILRPFVIDATNTLVESYGHVTRRSSYARNLEKAPLRNSIPLKSIDTDQIDFRQRDDVLVRSEKAEGDHLVGESAPQDDSPFQTLGESSYGSPKRVHHDVERDGVTLLPAAWSWDGASLPTSCILPPIPSETQSPGGHNQSQDTLSSASRMSNESTEQSARGLSPPRRTGRESKGKSTGGTK